MVKRAAAALRAWLPIFLAALPPGFVAQSQDRRECVTWKDHQARLESGGGMVRRSGRSPPAFYTGVFIRFTGRLKKDADSADILEAARGASVLVGSVLCGSPAAATDLREGDEILTVNEQHAYVPGVLPSLQSPSREGIAFRLQVRRGKDTLMFTVRSARRPKEAGGSGG